MKKLSKYIEQIRGVSYGSSDVYEVPFQDYVPVLRSNNIYNSKINLDNLVYVNPKKVKRKQYLRKGDILITASTGSIKVIGKNAFCERDYEASFGAFCKVVRPKDIYPSYLKYIFQSPRFFGHIQNIVNGANINNIKNEHIDNFQIHLPPLKTQQRIAAILDNAAALRDKTAQLLNEYDLLAQSIFLEMFGDPVINQKNHKKIALSKAVVKKKNAIVDGPFGSSIKKDDYVDEGIPIIRINNIRNEGYYDNQYKYLRRDKYAELIRSKVEYNDILIARVGNTIGKTCIFNKSFEALLSTTGVAKASLDQSRFNVIFIDKLMSIPTYIKYIQSFIRGAGQPYLNLTQIKAFEIIDVPFNLQNQFAEKIALIEQQKELARQELTQSEDLFNCLLQKAFKGELAGEEDENEVEVEVENEFRK